MDDFSVHASVPTGATPASRFLSPGYKSLCVFLLFLSLEAIFVVPVKVYPYCFLLLASAVGAWLLTASGQLFLPWRRNKQWSRCLFYLMYALGLFFLLGGDEEFFLRLLINVVFFLAASAFFMSFQRSRHLGSIKNAMAWALFVAIVLSATQTFANVAIGHLWLWPAHIHNSDDAYKIRDIHTVIFGDDNKNIWATKTLLAYLEFFALRMERPRWQFRDKVAFASILFVILYTSSRTAQLAFVAGFAGYMLRTKWRKVSLTGKATLFAAVISLTWIALVHSRLPELIDVNVARQGIADDGLMERLVMWIYFAMSARGFTWQQIVFGHGLSAVTEFVSRAFNANNLQNVFLNQFFDLGFCGVALYCSFLTFAYRQLSKRWRWLFVPSLLVVMSSQYFGFDPELMFFFAISVLLAESSPTNPISRGPVARTSSLPASPRQTWNALPAQ